MDWQKLTKLAKVQYIVRERTFLHPTWRHSNCSSGSIRNCGRCGKLPNAGGDENDMENLQKSGDENLRSENDSEENWSTSKITRAQKRNT